MINPVLHKVCKYYFTDSRSTFQLINSRTDSEVKINDPYANHLIAILKGGLEIELNGVLYPPFMENEFVFLPAFSKVSIKTIGESKILNGIFDMPRDVCTSYSLGMLDNLRMATDYQFTSVAIKPPMQQFLDLLMMYLEDGIQCRHLHEIKEREIFLIFRWYYSDEEFVKLFYPIIGKSIDFRSEIMQHYENIKNVDELAKIVNMSRSSFDIKFKEIFNMPPKQWILQQKAKSIRFFISKPEVTVSDVMIQYNFDSFTHFNRFCRQHFGLSPSELIKQKNKTD